jgi:hypothetical protein
VHGYADHTQAWQDASCIRWPDGPSPRGLGGAQPI